MMLTDGIFRGMCYVVGTFLLMAHALWVDAYVYVSNPLEMMERQQKPATLLIIRFSWRN